jgi:hypothetical protein
VVLRNPQTVAGRPENLVTVKQIFGNELIWFDETQITGLKNKQRNLNKMQKTFYLS